MANETPGAKLKRIRKALRIPQKQFAAQFGTSQAQVCRWEGDAKGLPPEVLTWVEAAEANVTDSASEAQPGTGSVLYSHPAPTFRRLWDEAPKRMEHLHARAVLRPSKTEGFADATLEITFQGLRIPRGDSLYLDCLGVLPRLTRVRYKDEDLLQFRLIDASNLSITKVRSRRARVEEVKDVHELIGPHALGYRISPVDESDEVSVTIEAERGVRLSGIDAIGVPVYADCPVSSVSLDIKFIGLKPRTPPKAEVYLLRRTLVDSRPIDLAGDLNHRIISEEESSFAFERLRFPKAGYGFCIAWDTLVLVNP